MNTITNIGIDLDGTITDFHRYLVRYGKKFLKKNNIKFKINNQKAYETNKIFDLKKKLVTATSLMSLTHQQKIGQTKFGDQNSEKTKIGGPKSLFLK